MPTVIVPTPYRGPTRGVGEIETTGSNVRECLEDAERQYPGLLPQVLDAKGLIHRFVKLFLNEVQLDAETALDTPVRGSDRVEILAAIAGG